MHLSLLPADGLALDGEPALVVVIGLALQWYPLLFLFVLALAHHHCRLLLFILLLFLCLVLCDKLLLERLLLFLRLLVGICLLLGLYGGDGRINGVLHVGDGELHLGYLLA
jgi:hypothetical protein